jgi:hypothetical protein
MKENQPFVKLIGTILDEVKALGVTDISNQPPLLAELIADKLDDSLYGISVADMLYLFQSGVGNYENARKEIVKYGVRANGETTNNPEHLVGFFVLNDFKFGKRQYIRD